MAIVDPAPAASVHRESGPGGTPTHDRPRDRRIPSLDGLRCISILLVIFGHLAHTRGMPRGAAALADGFALANVGVRVFFVISGFLITGLLLGERARSGTISLSHFYLRRTLRIFPAYYVFLGAMLIASRAGWLEISASNLLHAATYTTNYAPASTWPLGHTWSLSVEEQFYVLWPALLLVLGVAGAGRAALVVVIAAPILRLGLLHLAPDLPNRSFRFETVADAIAIGCLLAIHRDALWSSRRYREVLQSKALALLPIVVIALGAADAHPHAAVALVPLQQVGIALVIDRYVRFPGGAVGRLLNFPPAARIGVLSYSLYLWQQPFLNPYADGWLTTFPFNLAAVFAAAVASYALVELPVLRGRSRLERRLLVARPAYSGSRSESTA